MLLTVHQSACLPDAKSVVFHWVEILGIQGVHSFNGFWFSNHSIFFDYITIFQFLFSMASFPFSTHRFPLFFVLFLAACTAFSCKQNIRTGSVSKESLLALFEQEKGQIPVEGEVECTAEVVLLGDLDGDGLADGLIQYQCITGGGQMTGNQYPAKGWMLWLQKEGKLTLQMVEDYARLGIPEKIGTDGTVYTTLEVHDENDLPCCPSLKLPAEVKWVDGFWELTKNPFLAENTESGHAEDENFTATVQYLSMEGKKGKIDYLEVVTKPYQNLIVSVVHWHSEDETRVPLLILSQEFVEGEISGFTAKVAFPDAPEVAIGLGLIEDRANFSYPDGTFQEFSWFEQ
jgi:hypothetical protein